MNISQGPAKLSNANDQTLLQISEVRILPYQISTPHKTKVVSVSGFALRQARAKGSGFGPFFIPSFFYEK
jgi:hypothetical protein